MTLLNVAPFIKQLTLEACRGLLYLFKYVTTNLSVEFHEPNMKETHFKITLLLLEIFNSLLQFQYGGRSIRVFSVYFYLL